MAITNPITYNNMYCSHMDEKRINTLLYIREQDEIPNLKRMLFDFPPEVIKESIEKFISPRKLIESKGEDLNNYIAELRKYQTVGTAFMYFSPRCILSDGCGLGKTAEVAALINVLKSKGELTRFLIAVETSAIGQIQAELTRFTGLNIIALPSEGVKMKRVINNLDWTGVDGIVIKHSTLRSDVLSKWLALNLNEEGMCKIFNTFFLDESSVIKNPETKMSIYTRNICNIVKRVHMMNATAFETSIMDIYWQLDLMDEALLPKKWRIEKEYCQFSKSSYWIKENGKPKMRFRYDRSGYKNQEKFKESLKLVYFGRCKKDVGMDLPHVYKVYEVEPSNEQSVALSEGKRYMEVLNCPSLIPDMGIETDRKNVPKLERLCQLIENEFCNDKVMVFCFHLDAQKAIAQELEKIGRRPVILNGDSDDDTRFAAQQGFNSGLYDVIITNIKKSLNLYGGDVCIFYSVLTNPAAMFQAASRVDRNVDDKIKTFILLIYKGTDEYNFFVNVVGQRAKDARSLTIDAKTTVDFFYEYMLDN